jgi:hypothetical protein
MKKLVTALVLAMMVVSPAFAQSFNKSFGTGNIAHDITPYSPDGVFEYPETDQNGASYAGTNRNGHGAYAQAPDAAHRIYKHNGSAAIER